MSANTFLPRWTKRAVIEGSGRDPLGLSRVSDAFTDFLLPSIITTTNRARYYSFYPWALRESTASVEANNESEDFVEEFRKREAAFAMASKLGKETDLTIVGIDKVTEKLGTTRARDLVRTDFRVLPANDMGGFGQYYGGCLQTLGLGGWEEDGTWKVSDNRGQKIADAFAHSVAGTAYVRKRCGSMAELPLKILSNSASSYSLDGIRREEAKAERTLLTRMFFDLDEDAHVHASPHRQATLGQLLHVIDAYEAIGSSPSRRNIGHLCLFWPHYYDSLYCADGNSVPYEANPAFVETGAYWRQFCAHQFFTYATEEILQAILDTVSRTSEGLTKEGLVESIMATGFASELESVTNRKLSGPTGLMRYFKAGDDPTSVQKRFSSNHDLAEWWIYSRASQKPILTRMGRAFAILAQLHAKWRLSNDTALRDVAERADTEWWLGTCFEWGDSWLEDGPDWFTAISALIDAVYSHHEDVRFQKHKLDAAWLEKVGDRYTKLQDLEPEFRANRHSNAATILQDLKVLRDGGTDDPMRLTTWGRSTLKNVIKSRS